MTHCEKFPNLLIDDKNYSSTIYIYRIMIFLANQTSCQEEEEEEEEQEAKVEVRVAF